MSASLRLRQLRAVVVKELRDAVRDRRSLVSGLLYPLLAPASTALMLSKIAETQADPPAVEIAVVGEENAPALVEFLRSAEVVVHPAPADPEFAVRSGAEKVVVRIPEDFEERFRAARVVDVEVLVDTSRDESKRVLRRTEDLIEGWGGQVASGRLMARGVDPGAVQVLQVDRVDLTNPEKEAGRILGTSTMLVMLASFVCSMYLAMDTTAGERERRSLEALLINPVPRGLVVLGKYVATTLFGLAGVALTILTSGLALENAPLEELGVRLNLSAWTALAMFLLYAPVVLLAASAQMLVASFAKTFKEAQTYVGFLVLLPTIPGMFSALNPVDPQAWHMLVPVWAQQVLADAMVRGNPLPTSFQPIAAGGTVLSALACLAGTVALFRREGMTQGR